MRVQVKRYVYNMLKTKTVDIQKNHWYGGQCRRQGIPNLRPAVRGAESSEYQGEEEFA